MYMRPRRTRRCHGTKSGCRTCLRLVQWFGPSQRVTTVPADSGPEPPRAQAPTARAPQGVRAPSLAGPWRYRTIGHAARGPHARGSAGELDLDREVAVGDLLEARDPARVGHIVLDRAQQLE